MNNYKKSLFLCTYTVRPEDEEPDYALNKNGYLYDYATIGDLAFYLVSEGGSHPNATIASYTNITVEGIGIVKILVRFGGIA
jgi:hypothetical protein